MNEKILAITERIKTRSKATREAYLAKIEAAKSDTVHRAGLSCGNLAHGFAACVGVNVCLCLVVRWAVVRQRRRRMAMRDG